MEWAYAFIQMAVKHGPLVASLCVAFLAIVSLGAYFLKAKIDIMRQEAAAKDSERLAEVQARERERQALISQVGTVSERQNTIMTNHLAHDKIEREEIIKAMQENILTLRAISDDLKSHRTEEAARSGQFHEKLNEIHLEIRGKTP